MTLSHIGTGVWLTESWCVIGGERKVEIGVPLRAVWDPVAMIVQAGEMVCR